MATYTVSAGHKALGTWPLVASQVDVVTFASNVTNVQVHNLGTSGNIWVTTDGSTPSVPGAHVSTAALCVPPGATLDVDLRRDNDTLQLVSDSTPTVLIQVRDN